MVLPIANKIRLFGSTECKNCLSVLVWLTREKIDFEYIDAFDNDESIQSLCDEYNVDDLPHIQFLNEPGEVIFEHLGPIDGETFLAYIVEYLPGY